MDENYDLNDLQYKLSQVKALALVLSDYDETLWDSISHYQKSKSDENTSALANEAYRQADKRNSISMIMVDMLREADKGIDELFRQQFAKQRAEAEACGD